jgi:hypothetical protein
LNGILGLEQAEKGETVKRKVESILIIFFDIKGIVHKESVLANQTVNFLTLL